MKKTILLILIILFSCDEESSNIVKEEEEKNEEEYISDLIPPFTIHELIPEYTFWNHQFKIKLKYEITSDSIKTNFYYNKRKLNAIEKVKSGDYVSYIFLTPGNAYSDSLEIRYYEKDDSISVYTRMFEVVNSEVKVDSVNLSNYNFIKVYLNNYKYKDYITMTFKDSIIYDFYSKFSYSNYSEKYYGVFGELIDNAYLLFPNAKLQNFGLRIEAKEQVNKTKQLHSFDYFYKSKKEILSKNKIDNNLSIKLVDSYLGENDYIYLKFKNLYFFEHIDSIVFDSKLIDRWKLEFKPYIKENANGTNQKEFAEIRFLKSPKSRFSDTKIYYSNGTDTTFIIDLGIKNLFRNVEVNVSKIDFEFEEYTMIGDFQFVLDTLSSKYQINKYEKILKLRYNENNIFEAKKDVRFNYDSNNKPIEAFVDNDTLLLNFLDDNVIDFEYKIHHNKARYGAVGDIITLLNYKGSCIKDENEKEVIIFIENSKFNNLSISSTLKFYEYNTTTYIPLIEGVSKPNYSFGNNSFIKLTFEK